MGTAARWILVFAGLAILAAGTYVSVAQAGSGGQPWDPELSDNFVFMRVLPFVLGLGAVVGLFRAGGSKSMIRRGDQVRRFSPGTVIGHWIATVGFVLALPTGLWQYLGGILDVHLEFPLYLIYRIHYIGAALILFSVANFAAYWWVNGDRSLLPPRGEWRRHLAGLALELPRSLGTRLGAWLGLDLKARPQPQRFTFYETAFSFPTWTFALVLITITGLLKAMRYIYPIPGPVLYWASTLHVAAMVLLTLKVLDHLRYTLARWPLMVAMARGWISEGALRRVLDTTARPGPRQPEPTLPASAPAGVAGGSER
jgi:cytochrome b subunit of formate dehydrogenase